MRALLASACLALAACGSLAEPRINTVTVDRIVQRPCTDQRPPAEIYPDTDDKLAAIPDNDFEALGKVYRAGRDLRDARLTVDDVQIKGCARP